MEVRSKELEAFERQVRDWAEQYPQATKNGLKEAVGEIEKEARKNYSGGVVKAVSGKLLRALKTEVKMHPLVARVFIEPKQQYKAQALEYNTVITAKRKPYLMFQIGGEWKKVKQVVNQPKPAMGNAEEKVSPKVDDILMKHIMREVYGERS